MTPTTLINEARRRGLVLKAREGKLVVSPADLCPPAFADVLKKHKQELLCVLESPGIHLPADCWPWVHVAKQVLAGEFVHADASTAETLIIGLRSIQHPLCKRAMEILKNINQ